MDAQKKASELLDLLIEKEKAERLVKEINKKISLQSQEVSDAFDDEEIGPKGIDIRGIVFKAKDVDSFALDDTEKGLKWDDSKRWFDYLKRNGDGGMIKTKESVPWNTREKYLKELLAEGHELPDFIKHNTYQAMDWNKSALGRMVSDSEG